MAGIDCILVVEDHPETLRSMLRLLAMNGFAAYGASSYREAIEVAERERCKVLVSDILLPDGSGLDLMRHLRTKHGVTGIAVSGRVEREDRRAARAAGFVAHFPKPLSFSALLDALRSLAGLKGG